MKYPLEQLLTVKKNRLEQAIKILNEKKAILEKENNKLKELEKDRDKTLLHKQDKLKQLREELDQATTTQKIQQMKYYLKQVDEELKKKQDLVDKQKKVVLEAEKQVQLAKEDFNQKQRDLEKLTHHKKEWKSEQAHLEEKKVILEQDELGASTHEMKKREKGR